MCISMSQLEMLIRVTAEGSYYVLYCGVTESLDPVAYEIRTLRWAEDHGGSDPRVNS